MNDEILGQLDRSQLQLATMKKRSVAFIIDELLLSALLMIMLWDAFSALTTWEEMIALTNAYVIEYMVIKIIYQTLFVYQYGATIGKIAMKIRVIEVRTLATPIFFSAFNRGVFRIISEMIFYMGFIWAMYNPARQTWHDKTARTVVVDA
ncbi:MAG: RDD family protein [Epsilonproteobacteria bacterium]|nr:MAG: RDD family protein [Campylobacterota bacterium]